MQGKNRNVDIENGLVSIVGEGEGGTSGKSSIDIYTLPCVKFFGIAFLWDWDEN